MGKDSKDAYSQFDITAISGCKMNDDGIMYGDWTAEPILKDLEAVWDEFEQIVCDIMLRADNKEDEDFLVSQELHKWVMKRDVFAIRMMMELHSHYSENFLFSGKTISQELRSLLYTIKDKEI